MPSFPAPPSGTSPRPRVSFVDGRAPAVRAAVWPAADIFFSLPDNIQETFGLVVTEAMAYGLPVVGSGWDGYRDLISDGETGYLVPTRVVRGAVDSAPDRLMFGELAYDHFLAVCCQAVVVDLDAAGAALSRLVADPGLRARMGTAARQRAVESFGWERVIRAYEALWEDQKRELARHRTAAPVRGVGKYPPVERAFRAYPSAWLDGDVRVVATADAPPGVWAVGDAANEPRRRTPRDRMGRIGRGDYDRGRRRNNGCPVHTTGATRGRPGSGPGHDRLDAQV